MAGSGKSINKTRRHMQTRLDCLVDPGANATQDESSRSYLIGIISDTHGLLRPEALAALKGSDLIVHAGDIGRQEVLDDLSEVAPVEAVRGNNDRGKWADRLPITREIDIGEKRLFVVHRISDLRIDPLTEGLSAVIFGHSHRASVKDKNGVLFINPGAAGPRRFKVKPTVALLRIIDEMLQAEKVEI